MTTVIISRKVVEAWDGFGQLAGIPQAEIRTWLKGSMLADDPETPDRATREAALLELAQVLIAERVDRNREAAAGR